MEGTCIVRSNKNHSQKRNLCTLKYAEKNAFIIKKTENRLLLIKTVSGN